MKLLQGKGPFNFLLTLRTTRLIWTLPTNIALNGLFEPETPTVSCLEWTIHGFMDSMDDPNQLNGPWKCPLSKRGELDEPFP